MIERPDRRQFIHAGLLAGASLCTGCGGDPQDLFFSDELTIRLYTPWPVAIRQSWGQAFAEWLLANGRRPFRIDWKTIPETGLATGLRLAKRSADGLLGGHFSIHSRFKTSATGYERLGPVRLPVVRYEDNSGVAVAGPTKPVGWAFIEGIQDWGTTGYRLELGDVMADPLAACYSTAIWNSAPDAASAYARWVLQTRINAFSTQPGHARLGLEAMPLGAEAQMAAGVWRGGPGLKSALGIDSEEMIHWPEALSLFASPDNNKTAHFLEFCRATGRLRPPQQLESTSGLETSFRHDLAKIILVELAEDLGQTWEILSSPQNGQIETNTQAPGTFLKKAETYLVQQPPWPPASITDLAKRRGFEYVVALVEQLAADGDQRDWLIREFQRSPEPFDHTRLDTALGGALLDCIRFRVWLRAEWRAWVAQRCRRTRRVFEQGDFEAGPGDA